MWAGCLSRQRLIKKTEMNRGQGEQAAHKEMQKHLIKDKGTIHVRVHE